MRAAGNHITLIKSLKCKCLYFSFVENEMPDGEDLYIFNNIPSLGLLTRLKYHKNVQMQKCGL